MYDNMNKIKSLLSICMSSGNLKSGELSVEKSLQKEEACLVLTAFDASNNTKKKFSQKAFFYETTYIEAPEGIDKDFLGSSIGKDMRSVIAILDETFAGKLQDLLQ